MSGKPYEKMREYVESLFNVFNMINQNESVKKDINAWFPKIKKGGVIAGHDYTWCADVQKAVNEFFKGKTIYETEGCWSYFTEEE